MSELHVDVEPSKADVAAAVWGDVLGSGRVFAAPLSGVAYAIVMMAVIPWDGSLDGAAMFALGGLLFSVAMSLFFAAMCWVGSRSLARSPGMLDKVQMIFSDAGIEVTSPRRSMSADWTYWIRAYETQTVLVVCGPASAFYVLPKRQIARDTLVQIRSFLRRVLNGRVRFSRET